jgi:hypothetical protein
MLQIKLGLLSLTTVFVAILLTTTTAMGAELESRFYVEGTEITSPETFDAAVGPVQITAEISGIKLVIKCLSNSATGAIESEGALNQSLTIEDCSLYELHKGSETPSASCEVSSSQVYRPVEREREGRNRNWRQRIRIVERYRSRPGRTCALEGEYETEGSYAGSWDPEGLRESTEHTFTATPTEDELTLKGAPASIIYNMYRIKLLNGKKWRIG